jgi:4-amino-4-deoxy-L-arabinose transferase-like glycosyltransferase
MRRTSFSLSSIPAGVYVAVAVAAYLIHVVMMIADPPDPLRYSDSQSFWYTAGTLAEEGQFRERFDTGTVPTTWRPPLTALSLAGLRSIGGSARSVLVVNLLLLAGTAACAFGTVRVLGGSVRLGASVAALYLAHPVVAEVSRAVMSENPFLFLMALSMLLAASAASARRRGAVWIGLAGLFAGVAAGAAVLTRTVMFAVVPGLLVLVAVGVPAGAVRSRRLRTASAILLVLGMSIPLGLWAGRNARVNDRFVLVNTAGWYNLYVGTVYRTPVLRDPEGVRLVRDLRERLSEAGVAHELRHRAVEYAARHPAEVGRNAIAMALRFWWGNPNRVVGVYQVLLLGMCAYVAWRRRRDPVALALASMPAFLTLVHAFTFVEPRFFLPAYLPCLILLAYAALPGTGGRAHVRHDSA